MAAKGRKDLLILPAKIFRAPIGALKVPIALRLLCLFAAIES
jgi:hypothetical protein